MTGHPGALTIEQAREISAADTVVQLVVHPAALPDVVRWLTYRGIDVVPMPVRDDDLSTYFMAPRIAGALDADGDQGA